MANDPDSVSVSYLQDTVSYAWVIAAIVGFVVYLRLALATPVNSDGATEALMAWDMLHGNLQLSGWSTADVTPSAGSRCCMWSDWCSPCAGSW